MRHLDYTEIVQIQTLRGEKCTQSHIATVVHKHQSSISRFCRSHSVDRDPSEIWNEIQHQRVLLNKSIHCRIHLGGHLERFIIFRLTGGENEQNNPLRDSPDQIAGRWRYEQGERLSKDTIYKFIKEYYPDLVPRLRRQGRKYQKKIKTGDEKYQIPDRVMIDERRLLHPECEERIELGHWEIDTIVSAKTRSHGVITAVDRKSGYLLSHHTKKKTAWNICDGLRDMFEGVDPRLKKTLTSDNGREFTYHTIVSHETGMKFYFAHPYSPWERGTNENTNGLLRQFLPKKLSFADLTQKKLQTYNKSINSRPRKRHNYRTPEEILFGVTYRLTDLCNLN